MDAEVLAREQRAKRNERIVLPDKKFDELTFDERHRKYGMTVSENAQRGMRIVERYGNRGALKAVMEQMKGQKQPNYVQPSYPQQTFAPPQENFVDENRAKEIAIKLLKGKDLTEEDEDFMLENEELIQKMLE